MEGQEDPFPGALEWAHLECGHLDFHLTCQDCHHTNKECHLGCHQDLVHLATSQDHHPSWEHLQALGGLLMDLPQEEDQDFSGHTLAVGHL